MKKFVSLLLCAALGLGLMACGGGSTTAPATTPAKASEAATTVASAAATTPAAAESQPAAGGSDLSAEITWWAFPVFATVDGQSGKYEQGLVDEFNKKFPNVKVKVEMIDFKAGPEKIATAIQGNTAPDVLFDAPGRIISYGKAGKLANLNDLFTDEFKKDVNNENILGACSDGKDYYMYPLSSAPFLMAVNKKMIEEAGAWDMVPQTGERTWTTEQFDALNKKLAEAGQMNGIVFCSGQGGDQGTRAFISNLYNATITDKALSKYTMDSAEGVQGMDYVVKAVEAGTLTNGSQYNGGEAIEQFVAGNVNTCLLWSPGLAKNNAKAMADNNIEAFPLPLPAANGKPALEYLVNGFCVFNNGKEDKVAAAKEFVKFLCDDAQAGPANVKSTNAFPVRQSFGKLYGDDADMQFYAAMTKFYGTYYNTINGFAEMRPFWFANVQAALAGDKTAEKAMQDFVAESNKTIK